MRDFGQIDVGFQTQAKPCLRRPIENGCVGRSIGTDGGGGGPKPEIRQEQPGAVHSETSFHGTDCQAATLLERQPVDVDPDSAAPIVDRIGSQIQSGNGQMAEVKSGFRCPV